MSDTDVTDNDVPDTALVGELADIDSYVEPMPEASAEADEPLRKDVEIVAGENAIGGDLLQQILEGALLAAGKPLTVAELSALFEDHDRPSGASIREALAAIAERYSGRGFELREVASGYRFQVAQSVATWIARLWEEKPQRYSRALLETLSLIAYRQPITRGDIEDIRGVAVASNIMKTLVEREWVRIVGHKDVPGRPAMYATTRKFLDYFNLKNLDELPPLAEIRDLDSMNAELALEGADTPSMDHDLNTESMDDADDASDSSDADPQADLIAADESAESTDSSEQLADDGDELPA